MITINVIIRNELNNLLETITFNTRVINLHNVDLIIGRPEMIEHNLLTKMPSIILRERSLTNTVGKHDTLNTIYAKRDLLSYAEDDDGIVYDDVEPPYSTHEYNKNNNETDNLLPKIKGEGEFQQRLRDLCIEYKGIFATQVRQEPARVKPMKFEVSPQWALTHGGPARQQSILKEAEMRKQVNLLL